MFAVGSLQAAVMPNPPNHCRVFSTDMLPEPERYDACRDAFARQVMRLDVQRADDGPFYSRFAFVDLATAKCGSFDFSPSSYGRTRDLITDGNDDFVLLINRSAPLHESRTGAVLQAGGAHLQDNARAAYIGTKLPGAVWNIVIPRKTLLRLAPGAEDGVGAAIDPNSTALRLLRAYVSTLLEDTALEPRTLETAAHHLAELTALALSSGAKVQEGADHATRAARRLALTRDIRARANDPALTLAAIAKAHGISERYVQQLMADEGTSFTDYVLGLRLALAYRELVAPAHRARRISDIAFGAGFSDLSHFNRSFRRRYGATPSDVRRGAG